LAKLDINFSSLRSHNFVGGNPYSSSLST
jgi:hypothetical protein